MVTVWHDCTEGKLVELEDMKGGRRRARAGRASLGGRGGGEVISV